MKKYLLFLIPLIFVIFVVSAAHGSEIHYTQPFGNTPDAGNPADGGDNKIFADFFENWLNKGLALKDDGKYDDALKAFDNAFKYHPGNQNLTAKAWAGRAGVYDALERYDEALAASNEVIHLSPDDPELTAAAWVTGGIALRYLGRYEESLAAFDHALLLDPDNPKTMQLRVFTLRFMHTDVR